ncbi:MAG: DUF4157 domain-containing protein, partial [Flavobacteriaceae bacterium]|nr:DUF4157 domain-containing protein [Flavobacteriaceae bacterium]
MGKPGDKYEVEADKMADQVVRKSGKENSVQKKEGEDEVQQKPLATSITPLVQKMEVAEDETAQTKLQRKEDEEPVQKKEEEEPVQAKEEEEVQAKCNDCEKEGVQKKEDEEVQAKSDSQKHQKPSIENKLRNGNGGGKMDATTQGEMEQGFGADFSQVNIHTNSEAAQMSQDIGAQAFTHGNDIYFNKGKYNPNSKDGKHLLAHELTHTIQQKGMVQKKGISKTQDSIQRKASTPPADLACPVGNSSPSGSGENLSFPVSGSNFTANQELGINNFVRNWHLSKEQIRIDGYASVDGPETSNWHLSCQRALTARHYLMNPTDGSQGIPGSFISMFAHGETSQFGSLVQNRRVSINLPTKLPVRPVIGKPTVDHKTKFNAPDGSADTRLKVGVGEKVEFTASAVGNWAATSGKPRVLAGANKYEWTAPDRAGSTTVTFVSGTHTV